MKQICDLLASVLVYDACKLFEMFSNLSRDHVIMVIVIFLQFVWKEKLSRSKIALNRRATGCRPDKIFRLQKQFCSFFFGAGSGSAGLCQMAKVVMEVFLDWLEFWSQKKLAGKWFGKFAEFKKDLNSSGSILKSLCETFDWEISTVNGEAWPLKPINPKLPRMLRHPRCWWQI